MTQFTFDRRTFFKATAASSVATGSTRMAQATGATIGIVYVGPRDDFGWNQAHAVAAKALKTIPGVTMVEEENVPETDACAKAMGSMVNLDGANITRPQRTSVPGICSRRWQANVPTRARRS